VRETELLHSVVQVIFICPHNGHTFPVPPDCRKENIHKRHPKYNNREKQRNKCNIFKADNRQHTDNVAEHHRPVITEKSFCRMKVVRQKSETGTEQNNTKHHDEDVLLENSYYSDTCQRYNNNACCKTVEPVDQVNRVYN